MAWEGESGGTKEGGKTFRSYIWRSREERLAIGDSSTTTKNRPLEDEWSIVSQQVRHAKHDMTNDLGCSPHPNDERQPKNVHARVAQSVVLRHTSCSHEISSSPSSHTHTPSLTDKGGVMGSWMTLLSETVSERAFTIQTLGRDQVKAFVHTLAQSGENATSFGAPLEPNLLHRSAVTIRRFTKLVYLGCKTWPLIIYRSCGLSSWN